MSKCKICRNELKGIETTSWFDGLCEKCWLEKNYEKYPFKKGIYEKDQQIAELQKQLKEKEKEIEEFKRIGEKGHLNDLLEDQRKTNRILIKVSEQLLQRLKSQPSEIIEEIKGIAIMDDEEYSSDPILYKITEEELDTVLKEYRGKYE